MPYSWPLPDPVLQDSLDIPLDYLEFTGQAVRFRETQWICASVIWTAWCGGATHRIKLANYAIVAIEKRKSSPGPS
jgi:hypothetical protein